MARPNPTGHPARFSTEILGELAAILESEFPDWMGRPLLLDPCAGTGEALAELQQMLRHDGYYGFEVAGIEIEAPYIVEPEIVHHGDSTDRDLVKRIVYNHPTGQAVIVTSVVYANGVADSFIPKDESKRFTYIASLLRLTGNPNYRLHRNNQAGYGYRGTKRGGTSKRRDEYWRIADEMVSIWAEIAQVVLLNVSDFKHSSGEIEPHVMDWRHCLARHGFTDQLEFPVGTPRMRNGANSDQRVEVETIIRARRPELMPGS